jgi:hypothetical protein
MANKKWFETADEKLREIQLYEIVAEEIEGDIIYKGLWTKALADANGDEKLQKSLYIKLRVQMIKDEHEQALKRLEQNLSPERELEQWIKNKSAWGTILVKI